MSREVKTVFSTRDLALIPIFAAMTAILAQIAIPLPFTTIPISFGMVAVYTSGILLKPKQAIGAQACYLLLGAVGIPVFGNLQGGLGALFGPTGGYLMTYPIIAGIVAIALNSRKSRQTEKIKKKGFVFLKAGMAMIIAHTILYLGGTAWFTVTTENTFYQALSLAVIPFIPLDIIKIAFCVLAIVPFRTQLVSAGVLRIDE